MNGAGHGSTMEDMKGNIWHTATMRISKNHNFERRVGIWPCGLDADGELFCNQRYGDWPIAVSGDAQDPWENPKWYLLSYGKKVSASSFEEGKEPDLIANEDCRNWWRAAGNKPGEWVQMDLGSVMDVRAIQINFADDKIADPIVREKLSERRRQDTLMGRSSDKIYSGGIFGWTKLFCD